MLNGEKQYNKGYKKLLCYTLSFILVMSYFISSNKIVSNALITSSYYIDVYLNGCSGTSFTEGQRVNGAAGGAVSLGNPAKPGHIFKGWLQFGKDGIGPGGLPYLDATTSPNYINYKTPTSITFINKVAFGYPSDCLIPSSIGNVNQIKLVEDGQINGEDNAIGTIGSNNISVSSNMTIRCMMYAKIPIGYTIFPTKTVSTVTSNIDNIPTNNFVGTGQYKYYEMIINTPTSVRLNYFGSFNIKKTNTSLPDPTSLNPCNIEIGYFNYTKCNGGSGNLALSMGTQIFKFSGSSGGGEIMGGGGTIDALKTNQINTLSFDSPLIITPTNHSDILVALFEPNNVVTYTITYNANGGSNTPPTQSFSPNTGDIQLNRNIPNRTNYAFYGWSRTPTGSPEYQPLSKMSTTGVSSNITLYAIWGSSSSTRYISYLNSTTEEGYAVLILPVSQAYAYSATNSITISDFIPTRSHHTFLGWSKIRGSNIVDYLPGGSYPCSLASTQLFPVWSYNEGSTQSMYFDKLSQPTATGIPDSILLDSDNKYFIPEVTPIKTGDTFAGWGFTAQTPYSAFTDLYLPGEPVPKSNDDLVLYPQFISSSTSKIYVTYALNGGVDGPVVQCLNNHPVGSSVYYDFRISSKIPKKDGFNFLGWSRNSTSTVVDFTAGASTTFQPQVNFTLYAVWQALPEETPHTLTFDANGGLNCPANIPYIYNANTIESLYLPTEIPTLEGKDFVGWSIVKGSATAQYLAGSSWTLINEDTTLYAVWVDKPIIRTITYNANGGSGAPSSQSYTYNASSSITLSNTVPIRTDYTFLGWSKSSTATSATYLSGATWSCGISENTTLYAIWVINFSPYKIVTPKTLIVGSNGTCSFCVSSTISKGTLQVFVPSQIIFTQANKSNKIGNVSLSGNSLSSTVPKLTGTVSIVGLTAGSWCSTMNIHFVYIP